MSNLIEKIWNYEYNPAEKHIVCLTEIKSKNDELDAMEREFLAKYFDLLDYLLADAYTKGAKFAGRLFYEIMTNEE